MMEISNSTTSAMASAIPFSRRFLTGVLLFGQQAKSCSAKFVKEVKTANAYGRHQIVVEISSVLTERVLRPGVQRHVYVAEVRQLSDGWTGDIRGHRRRRCAGDDRLIQEVEVLDDIADSLRRIHIHLAHQLRYEGIRIADVIADHPDARCCDRGAGVRLKLRDSALRRARGIQIERVTSAEGDGITGNVRDRQQGRGGVALQHNEVASVKGGIADPDADAGRIEGYGGGAAGCQNAPGRKRVGIAGRASRGACSARIEVDGKFVEPVAVGVDQCRVSLNDVDDVRSGTTYSRSSCPVIWSKYAQPELATRRDG